MSEYRRVGILAHQKLCEFKNLIKFGIEIILVNLIILQVAFLRGKGADLRSAPFPLNNPHTLHAFIVTNLKKLSLF
ncbi:MULTISPECIES: hypothetical protein [unclassified Campylobacter]|uniref:hypothetical protein n=1 Tax=unclassified Campylobacter TaxID=2593542 RepID=UPI0022E9BCEF|nr:MULTISPECIES: hypothetical protein [unclassified Campylobacter]MDA3042504.1 hypothetical protein [Campylobacter sp. JMF_09 ED2]MDA3044682.1 hypothetical protein [Campylobacter sp. JMF_07 ED4]MDA3063196.1 hypothetical protein [Campylobacter sp. JMF_11 EL3]MDA3071659.1 hypothetical protein [Campylobacter sp. VBCF_03 NA9]MDA3074277.1 hypothetical protein [Campylobacter sp. JMF_05 ED3]